MGGEKKGNRLFAAGEVLVALKTKKSSEKQKKSKLRLIKNEGRETPQPNALP